MDIALEWDARKYGDGSGGGQGAPGEVGWQEPGSAEAGEQNGNQGGDKQSEANQEQ